jgi:hypothetical protein
MEVGLRKRLEGAADISISQGQQTAVVRFQPAARTWSPEAFREAARETAVKVLRFEIEACGRVEGDDPQRWLVAGESRYLVTGSHAIPLDSNVCVSGPFDDAATPPRLQVARLEPLTR